MLFRSAALWVIVVWFLSPAEAWAQANAVDPAAEIQRALQRAEYKIAADLADSAITHFDALTPRQLAQIHTLRALIAFQRNELPAADAHFLSALQLIPDYQLDPIFFSPAMQNRFAQLRARMPKIEIPVRVETRYVMLPDPRLQAAWKSLLLPGWGQRAKGQRQRGTFFTVAVASLATATLVTYVLRQHAEDDYLAANETNVSGRYDTFNRYHRWRNSLALGLGVAWGASVLDALIVPARAAEPAMGTTPVNNFSNAAFLFSLRVHL